MFPIETLILQVFLLVYCFQGLSPVHLFNTLAIATDVFRVKCLHYILPLPKGFGWKKQQKTVFFIKGVKMLAFHVRLAVTPMTASVLKVFKSQPFTLIYTYINLSFQAHRQNPKLRLHRLLMRYRTCWAKCKRLSTPKGNNYTYPPIWLRSMWFLFVSLCDFIRSGYRWAPQKLAEKPRRGRQRPHRHARMSEWVSESLWYVIISKISLSLFQFQHTFKDSVLQNL